MKRTKSHTLPLKRIALCMFSVVATVAFIAPSTALAADKPQTSNRERDPFTLKPVIKDYYAPDTYNKRGSRYVPRGKDVTFETPPRRRTSRRDPYAEPRRWSQRHYDGGRRDTRDHWNRRNLWNRRNRRSTYNNYYNNNYYGGSGYRTNYSSSIGINFIFGEPGFSSYRWASTPYSFYRPGYWSYANYRSSVHCERIVVEANHYDHSELISVKQCYNPIDGYYIIQGSERIVNCTYSSRRRRW